MRIHYHNKSRKQSEYKISRDGIYCSTGEISNPLSLPTRCHKDDRCRRMLHPTSLGDGHGLPFTCRYFYEMTALTAFSTNIISFDTIWILSRWARSLEAKHLNAIRLIAPCNYRPPPLSVRNALIRLHKVYVAPLNRLEHLRHYHVWGPWKRVTTYIQIEDCYRDDIPSVKEDKRGRAFIQDTFVMERRCSSKKDV